MSKDKELIPYDKIDQWLSDGSERRYIKICEEGLVDINFYDITPGMMFMVYAGDKLMEDVNGCKEFEATSFPYVNDGLQVIEVSAKW